MKRKFNFEPSDQEIFLAAFTSVQPAGTLPVRFFRNDTQTIRRHQRIVVVENDRIEWEGQNKEPSQLGAHCKYLIGIKDGDTIKVTEASLVSMRPIVKSLKNMQVEESLKERTIAARNDLGETFGTKKAKSMIKATERNTVDVGALEGVADSLQEKVEAKAAEQPTVEQIEKVMDEDRSIPKHDMEATKPEDIYDMEDIAPSSELNEVPLDKVLKAKNPAELKAAIGEKTPEYILERINSALKKGKKDRRRIRSLIYLNFMHMFRRVNERIINRPQALYQELSMVPEVILNGFLRKFTVLVDQNGKPKRKFTPRAKDKLISYMFVLCLAVDNFAVEMPSLGKSLGISAAKIADYARGVGCKIDLNREKKTRIAVLTAPLKFEEKLKRGGKK